MKRKEALKKAFIQLSEKFPQPHFTRFRNLKLFHWINENGAGKTILNLGAGDGRFDHYLSKNVKTIKLDIDPSKRSLDVIADAHFLPFKNESFDMVYSIAVMEHVRKPWIVASEISRILRVGGHIAVELPFLNVIHDKEDYFRFTDKGIRSLFDEDEFEVVLEQVGSGGGSFLSVFLFVYLEQFIPSMYLKALWRLLMGYLFSLLKYMDLLVPSSELQRVTANSFSFVARKK